MMNFVAISLVLSSLVAAGVWSPSSEKHVQDQKEQVIVKEGHRVVVVEYDERGKQNTKVSISPEHEYHIPKSGASVSEIEEKIDSAAADAVEGAKNKFREASSVLPNIGQGISDSKSFGEGHFPGELVCDAFGKCKHKIASAIGKTKDTVMGAAESKKEKAYEAKEKVSEVGREAIARNKEMAHEAKEAVQDAFGKAKEGVSETLHDVKESAKESMEKAKRTVKETKDVGKTIGEDVAMNISEQLGHARDSIMEKAKEAKEGTEHAKERIKTGAHRFFDSFGQFLYGLVRYMRLPEALNALMGVLNLLGFATAYGMSVWVTFISSYVLADALPRQQFGMAQSKIYPVYFRVMAVCIGLALLGHMPRLFSTKAGMFQGFNLLASLLMVFANSVYLEPRATKVMFERMKVEKEEGRGRESLLGETSNRTTEPAATTTTAKASTSITENTSEQEAVRPKIVRLSERLKKLNTYSSILNILSLMCLSWHLVYLSQRLQMSC